MTTPIRCVRAWVIVITASAMLCGCAVDRIQKAAQTQMQLGLFEDAIATLDEGINEQPRQPILRMARITTQDAIASRLLSTAIAEQSAGRATASENAISRLLRLDPSNIRAQELKRQLQVDTRVNAVIEKAKQLIDVGALDPAITLIEEALRSSPTNDTLLSLQQRLDTQRQANDLRSPPRLGPFKPISLEFRDAGVRSVFEAISRTTGINFVIDKDVQPELRTTVFLHDTQLNDALDLITGTNNLARKILDPSTVLIYPNTPEKQRTYQDLVVRAFYPANSSAKQIADLFKSVLKIRDPYVDERTNMVVIRESGDLVRLAERLIALQDMPDAEVVLEVEVLEVSNTRLTELGIKYPSSFTLTPLSATGGANLTLQDLKGLNSSRYGISTPSVTLNLRREIGDVNTLANPRIRTKNREKAKILIGDKLPVVTTTATSTGFVSENVQFIDVGLKLEVIPTVHSDGNVSIKIDLEVSSLSRQVRTPNGSVTYEIGTRNASTTLNLKDGETQLLAGLIKREDRTEASRVPGVGDVPILGRLFSSQLDDGKQSEVVLSIMPRIVRSAQHPDIGFAEFWSGTEANARTRALLLPLVQSSALTPSRSPNPSTVPPSPQLSQLADPITISLQGPSTVDAEDAFQVSIDIESAMAIRGMPFTFEFDKNQFIFEDLDEGAFLKKDGVQLSLSKSVQEDLGRVMIGIIRNSSEGIGGSGNLVNMRFRALRKTGVGQLGVLSASPIVSSDLKFPLSLPKMLSIDVRSK